MMRRSREFAALAVATACLAGPYLAFGGEQCDSQAGADVYANKCSICHSILEGQNGAVGPSLFRVVGRRPAKAPGFAYSAAMAGIKEPWTPVRINWFLRDPPGRVAGTYMAFSGLGNDAARAAVICYLASIGN